MKLLDIPVKRLPGGAARRHHCRAGNDAGGAALQRAGAAHQRVRAEAGVAVLRAVPQGCAFCLVRIRTLRGELAGGHSLIAAVGSLPPAPVAHSGSALWALVKSLVQRLSEALQNGAAIRLNRAFSGYEGCCSGKPPCNCTTWLSTQPLANRAENRPIWYR